MRTLFLGAILAGMIPMQLACAQSQPADPQPLSMKYDGGSFDVVPVPLSKVCPIKLLPPVDARMNKDTLGANYSKPLLSGDPGPWVTSGLQNLKAFGFPVEMATDANRQGSIVIASKITRAYTWHIGMKLFGTVVLKVDYTLPNGAVESKTYRASGDKTNMAGADDEYMTTLNYSFNRLLHKMAEDLGKRCTST